MPSSYHLIVPLPHGRIPSTNRGRLSVYFVPRLQATGELKDWTDDWRDWPRVIQPPSGIGATPLRLTAEINGTVAPNNTQLDVSDAAWVSAAPSSDAWRAVFGTGAAQTSITVDRFRPVYRDNIDLAPMYDAASLSERIESLHQSLATNSPDGPPTANELQGLATFGAATSSPEIANFDNHLAPITGGDIDTEPTPDEADFHQALTFLQSHPELLRVLGLVVDLEVVLPPATGADIEVTVGSNYVAPGGEAVPLLVTTDDAFWPIDGPGTWPDVGDVSHSVSQVDLGSGVSTIGAAQRSVDFVGGDDPVDIAPLTSAGLYIARTGLDLATEVEDTWDAQREFEESIYDYFGLGQVDPVPVAGELLTVGRRYDVWDETAKTWFSLWEREVPDDVSFPRDASLTIPVAADEGWMTYTANTEMLSDVRPVAGNPGEGPALPQLEHTEIRLSPIVFSWRGWSLAAAPPGRAFSGIDGAKTPTANEPSTDMLVKAVVDYDVPDGVLPRLRYLRQYKFRARTVDYAGNSRALSDAHPGGLTETELVTFGRQNPLAQPVAVRREDKPIPGWGDTSTTMVIKSELDQDPATVTPTSRVIFPGQVTQFQCELHGFPAPDGLFTDQGTYDDIVARTSKSIEEHTNPEIGTGELIVDPKTTWRSPVDYLVEPAQAGYAIDGLPGAGGTTVVPLQTTWPVAHTTSLEIRAGSDAPVVDPAASSGPAVVAEVPIGVTRHIGVSGSIASALLPHWRLFNQMKSQDQAALARQIENGQHWMFSRGQGLTLVHAVRRPLAIPGVVGTPVITRGRNQTDASMSGTFTFDVKSTDRLAVFGTWTDPIDTPGAAGGLADQETTKLLFDQREDYAEVTTRPIDQALFEVGDTKRHEAFLSLNAFSRYARYFTERSFVQFKAPLGTVDVAPSDGIASMNLEVRSSAGTARRGVDYEVDGPKGTITRLQGSSLPVDQPVLVDFIRLPINRRFDEAGAAAVSFRIPNTAAPGVPAIVEALPAFARTRYDEAGAIGVFHVGQTIRVWLDRPWFTSGVGELLGVLVGASPEGPLSEIARDAMSPTGPERGLQLGDFSAATSTESNLSDPGVSVAGHDVVFDADRQLWFSDIVIDGDVGYRPFVKLALVRYQPESVSGAHVSETVFTEPIRLGSSRQCEVERNGDAAVVTVSGLELGNEMSAWFQESDPAIADSDLSWNDVTDKVLLGASAGATETTWTGALTLPTAVNPVRLVVEDAEVLTRQRPAGPNNVRNVSYVDTINVPADWTAPVTTTTTTSTSTTTSTTVPDEGGPARIEDLAAAGGDEAVLLTWTVPADGGAPLTGYRVERRTGGNWTLEADLPESRTKHVVRGLTNGDVYEFRVRASNADEDGPWSDSVAATPEERAPGKVRRLRAVTGGGLVRLRWRAAADRGSPVLGYRIDRRLQGGDWGSPVQVDASDTAFTVADEPAGSVVGFRVRAVNAVGSGAWSNVEIVTVDGSGAAPDQVHGVALTPGLGELTVTWLPAGDNGAPLIRYDVQMRDPVGVFDTSVVIDPDQLVHVVDGLTAGTTYEVRVRAINVVDEGNWSTVATGSPS